MVVVGGLVVALAAMPAGLPAAPAAPVSATVAAPAAAGTFRWPVDGSVTLAPAGSRPVTPTAPRRVPRPRVDCRKVRCVALTFDDGPWRHTGRLLDELAAADAPATFFLFGAKVSARRSLVRRMIADGHEVGNHTWSHPELTRLTLAQQRREVVRGANAIKAAGVPRPRLVRPPFGAFNGNTRKLGAPLINWDVDTLDWKYRNSASVIRRALKAKRGSIILMHDTLPTTVKAVPTLIRKLRARGFVLVTVGELLGRTTPGHVYFHGRR